MWFALWPPHRWWLVSESRYSPIIVNNSVLFHTPYASVTLVMSLWFITLWLNSTEIITYALLSKENLHVYGNCLFVCDSHFLLSRKLWFYNCVLTCIRKYYIRRTVTELWNISENSAVHNLYWNTVLCE